MAERKRNINWNEVQLYPLSSHRLEGAENIKRYCMGGNAIVTLTSPTGVHYTYYLRSPFLDDKEDFAKDVRFVYALGTDQKWFYIGGLYANGTYFRATRNSSVSGRSPVFKGVVYLVKMMNKDFDTPMILQHEGCCGKCGRRLTDPISIERGIGPKCYNLMYKKA